MIDLDKMVFEYNASMAKGATVEQLEELRSKIEEFYGGIPKFRELGKDKSQVSILMCGITNASPVVEINLPEDTARLEDGKVVIVNYGKFNDMRYCGNMTLPDMLLDFVIETVSKHPELKVFDEIYVDSKESSSTRFIGKTLKEATKDGFVKEECEFYILNDDVLVTIDDLYSGRVKIGGSNIDTVKD